MKWVKKAPTANLEPKRGEFKELKKHAPAAPLPVPENLGLH
jgi:hypothetical protein